MLKLRIMVPGALLCAAWAATAAAQVQEKQTLTLDGAKAVLAACEAEARKHAATGVIAVVDDGGHLIALHRMDGTFAAGARISIGKARTAAMFKKPTRIFEDIIRNGRTAMVALDDFTPLQGGVPIVVGGQVVGAVGVSGAASAQQDEEIAMAGTNALAQSTAAAADATTPVGDVMHFDRQRVETAFAKGEPLYTGSVEIGCAVNPSRRDAPGEAEIHCQTDVMYFREGAATLVTGGTVLNPVEHGAGEIRGTGIENGRMLSVAAGDVVIIPRGVPHWFSRVEGTLLYYVVKVRS